MKIIHTADIHLNSPMKALDTVSGNKRKEETLATFERLIDYAKNNDVKAVIIAGDMFDTSRVSLRTCNRVLQAIISVPDITFFYLSGNHDEDNFISSLKDVPQNLFVFNDEWSSKKIGDVRISGATLSSTNVNFIHDTLKLDENEVNIVVLHGQIAGYISGEKSEVISLPKLKDRFIDYLALGHYHTYSQAKLDERGVYAYSGCLEGRGFDETGEKGFVLLDIDSHKIKTTFVPFAKRCLYELRFEIDCTKPWYSFCQEIISECKKYADSSMLKIELFGERNLDYDVDTESLSSKLNDVFFFAKVVDKTSLKIQSNDYMQDKSVKGEFIRAVMSSDLDDDLKNKVILCGVNALKGEN